jgi:hypothetical protein
MIAEAAYYKTKKRNFYPGHEIRDWLEAKKKFSGRYTKTILRQINLRKMLSVRHYPRNLALQAYKSDRTLSLCLYPGACIASILKIKITLFIYL